MALRTHTTETLLIERDRLHLEMVRECEELLRQDELVNNLQKRLGDAIANRDKVKARLDKLRLANTDVESDFTRLTGQQMPRPPKMK